MDDYDSLKHQLEVLLRVASDGIHVLDRQGYLVEASDYFFDMLGYRRTEAIGLHVSDWDAQWDREQVMAVVEHNFELGEGIHHTFETQHRHRDGHLIPVEITARIYRFPHGPSLLYCSSRNIGERRDHLQRIQRLTNLYRALSEINQAIVRLDDRDKLYPLICETAVNFAGFSLAFIAQPTADGKFLKPTVTYGSGIEYLTDTLFPLTFSPSESLGPAALCYLEGRSIFVTDFQNDPMTKPWWSKGYSFGWLSSATFPIQQGARTIAVIGVYATIHESFDDEAIAVLDEMVRDISFALEMFERDQARQRAEQTLIAREKHFRAYFERSMVGMAATGPDKRWIEVNQALCDMLGYNNTELQQLTWDSITHPGDLEINDRLFQSVFLNKTDEYELDKRFLHKDGTIVHAHVAVRAIRDEDGGLDYLVALVDDISELRLQQIELERRVYFDTLTGLPNRALLTDRLDRALGQLKRSSTLVAVCFMDLDGFKAINDQYGHAFGDRVLTEIGQRVSGVCRATDTVARFGGDEFVVILDGFKERSECQFLVDRILDAIATPFTHLNISLTVSASIGVAVCPDDITDGETLLRHADQAMYLAKQSGRNRVYFFDAQSEHQIRYRSHILDRLEHALDHNELEFFYQPKVNMATRQVVGAEALIRWRDPQRGLILPGEFMPLVEGTSFEIRLSEWVINQALHRLSEWQKSGLLLTLSVNIPAHHLQSHGFVDYLKQQIRLYPHLPPLALELEILETATLGNLDAAIKKMQACLDIGLHFSIDDFGTGYASLSYLRRLPADTIKIDQVFIRNMLQDPEDLSIVQGVIELARAFHKTVIAEGVETAEHGYKLLDMGCLLAQGYGIAKPMPSDKLQEWVREFKGFPNPLPDKPESSPTPPPLPA